jgi:DNA-binding HxlR family transcriptional regulator
MDNQPKTDEATTELLNNLRQEIKNLRNDMNRIEESVLKQRLQSIEQTLTQNHLKVYVKQRSENLNQEVTGMLKQDCSKRDKCTEYFRGKIEDSTQIIQQADPKKAIADLDDKIAENELIIEKSKGATCEACFVNFNKRLKREKRAYQEITLVEDLSKPEVGGLDVPFLVDNLLEPLANYSRLTILSSVKEGKRSFSELSKITDTKAGHLAFHLKKLVAAKLIAQEATKGDYIITERGLELIKKLESLQPQKTV